MMQMTFYFGYDFTLLFNDWTIKTKGGKLSTSELVGAIAAVFFLGVFLEGIKVLKEWLSYLTMKYSKLAHFHSGYKQLDSIPPVSKAFVFVLHALQALLQLLQVSLGYLLMLVVMTYNGWMFLAVVFGTSVGYLALGWLRYVYDTTTPASVHDCH
ncbi:hypothetical protein EMCRGX_G015513 [Ephydatia muelleri]